MNERGELLTTACRREAREETGLEVVVCESVGVMEMVDRGKVIIAYNCEVTGGQLQDSDELKSVSGFTREQTIDLPVTEVTAQILRKVGWRR